MRRLALLFAVLAALLAGCGGSTSHAHLWLTPGHAKHAYSACVSSDCGPWSVTLNWQVPVFPNTTGYWLFLNGSQVGSATSSPFTFYGWDCGTANTLGVEAHDGSGGHGPLWTTSYTAPACPAPTDPATIHVAQSAAGTGDGSSCANAEAVSVLSTATDWTAGQVIGLCGTITSQVVAHGSGTSGNPITVYWEPNAKLSEPVCSSATGCFNTNSQTNLTLNGGTNGIIESNANGSAASGYANHVASVGIWATGCTGCTIENLTIQNTYVNTQGSNCTGTTSPCGDSALSSGSQDMGIYFWGSNVTIADNTLHDNTWEIETQLRNGDGNINIYGNEIYNQDHAISLNGDIGPETFGTVQIYDNHIHDFANWDTGSTDAYHHDGIHCFTGSFTGSNYVDWTGVYIYNNRIDGNTGYNMNSGWGFLEGGTTSGRTPCGDTSSKFYYFNNVMVGNNYMANGWFRLASGVQVAMYNNTEVCAGTSDSRYVNITTETDPGSTNVAIENNAATSCSSLISMNGTSQFAAGQPSHNVYANSGSNAFSCGGTTYSTASYASWAAACGETSGSYSASLSLNADGSPQAGSSAIGAGANLTSLCTGNLAALCSTYAGPPVNGTAGSTTSASARPSSGAWNAGAF